MQQLELTLRILIEFIIIGFSSFAFYDMLKYKIKENNEKKKYEKK